MTARLDRRVLRTRRALRDALVALLHERAWDDIAVADVCARADVGRSTFYLHFGDKEELLVGGFGELAAAIRAAVAAEPVPPGVGIPSSRRLVEHALENRRLFRALVGRRTGQVVVRHFRELVLALVQEDLARVCPEGPARTAEIGRAHV
jgi:AcrR family transcriptional regulator